MHGVGVSPALPQVLDGAVAIWEFWIFFAFWHVITLLLGIKITASGNECSACMAAPKMILYVCKFMHLRMYLCPGVGALGYFFV